MTRKPAFPWRLAGAMLLAVMVCLVGTATGARAHEPSMAVMDLREVRPNDFFAQWTLAPSEDTSSLRPMFPRQCQYRPPELLCADPGFAGRIGFAGIGTKTSAVMFRVSRLDGDIQTYTLTPAHPVVTLASGPREGLQAWAGLVFAYVALGADHIVMGVDHLLFVLGLVWIVGWRWMLVKTITAFTIAHSLTLAATTLGMVTPPVAAVNATVALSILFLGPEMLKAWRNEPSLTRDRPYVVAFAFGLLHGFGFATALTDAGLPRVELPWALLGFNIGVEAGQLGFILLLALLARAGRQLQIHLAGWSAAVPAYIVGGLGAFWTIGRTATILGAL